MKFLHVGCGEKTKAGCHGVALGLFVVMGVYNAAAYLERDEPEAHLAVNALLYAILAAFEGRQVARHLDRTPR